MSNYGYQGQQPYGAPSQPSGNQGQQYNSSQPSYGPSSNSNQTWQNSQQWGQQQSQQYQQPQQAAPGYNPGTYGVMPGAHQTVQSPVAPALPPRNPPSTQAPSNYGQQQYTAPPQQYTAPPQQYAAPPPPPPKIPQPYSSSNHQTQPQNSAAPPIPQPYSNTSGGPAPGSQIPPLGSNINEQQPAYIPPSLSGQGVASYMPSNTNPLPGVYVPPPPDVPAWTQASQISAKNKFKYTKPNPTYQNTYGTQPTTTQGYQNDGQYVGSVPSQPAQGQAAWSQSGPTSIGQQWNQSQANLMQHNYQTPISQATSQNWQQSSVSQAGPPQTYAPAQYNPDSQPPVSSQNSFNSASAPHHDPVSPLSTKQSMSFGRDSIDQGVQRTDSSGYRRPPVGSNDDQPTNMASMTSPAGPTATGASALGFGGPSDWEHFGHGADEIDDTAHFGAQSAQPIPSPKGHVSELPSQPSPPPLPEGIAEIATEDRPGPVTEGWPTPPAPSHVEPDRSNSRPPTVVQQGPGRDRFQPTPPPAARNEFRYSNIPSSDSRGGTPAQYGARQSAPSSRPSSTANMKPSWQQPPSQPQSSFMNDGGWVSPETPTPDKYQFIADIVQQPESRPDSRTHQPAPSHQSSYEGNHPSVSPELPPKTVFSVNETSQQPPEGASGHNQQPVIPKEETTEPVAPPKAGDLIPDLDPWYIGSLERYINMLREEASATAVEDKIRIFRGFLAAESQARGVPYHFDAPTHITPGDEKKSVSTDTETRIERPISSQNMSTIPERPKLPPSSDSFVMVSPEDQQYSPGGRPIVTKKTGGRNSPAMINKQPIPRDQSIPRTSLDDREDMESPGEFVKPPPLFSKEVPLRKESPANTAGYAPFRHNATKSDSTQSAILTPASSAAGDALRVDQTPATAAGLPSELLGFKPYVPPGGAKTSPNAPTSPIESHQRNSSTGRRNDEDLFFSQPAPKVENIPASSSSTPASLSHKKSGTPSNVPANTPMLESQPASYSSGTPASLSHKKPGTPSNPPAKTPAVFDTPKPQQPQNVQPASSPNLTRSKDLKSHLPPQIPNAELLHPRLLAIEQQLKDKFPQDFVFISEISRSFDRSAAETRSRNERQRHKRQEDEEDRTTRLFDDNEISYAEIGPLEDSFKAKEANLKAQEDLEEYTKYTSEVFEEVYLRLQKEIAQLMEFWQETMGHLETGLAGKEALTGGDDANKPANTVHAIRTARLLHVALEERHDKVAAAVAERDKKYRKTQVQPLYAAGNIKKVKELERHFDTAERSAILASRDQRTIRIRDMFMMVEDNVQRNIEDNLHYRRDILECLTQHPALVDTDTKNHAKATLKALADNSTGLMRALGEIERELCNAEFDVEVARARARPEGVDDQVVKRVEEQGAKEVERVERDQAERMAVLEDAWKEVERAFETPAPVEEKLDEREMAKRRALEEAKRRNGDF